MIEHIENVEHALIKITPANISEIGRIRHLWEQLHEYNKSLHLRYFGYELKEKWDHKQQEFLKRIGESRIKFDIVQTDTQIVGYCISSITGALEGEIVSIYIIPEYRNHGIGKRLMDEHIKWLKNNDAKSIFLYVHPCNIDAIRFYWRYNFFSNSPLMEMCDRKDFLTKAPGIMIQFDQSEKTAW